jgi:DNA polymerase-3 subunit epsilon
MAKKLGGEQHNEQVENVIAFLVKNRPSFTTIDKGRSAEERSCIWVENSHFYGMGYIASDIGLTDPSSKTAKSS